MKPINRTATQALFLLTLAGFALAAQAAGKPQEIQMAGYLLVPHRQSPQSYNAGFSMYTAVWPLFHGFDTQPVDSGSFGTWLVAHLAARLPSDQQHASLQWIACRGLQRSLV